jgi:hypothetical protein
MTTRTEPAITLVIAVLFYLCSVGVPGATLRQDAARKDGTLPYTLYTRELAGGLCAGGHECLGVLEVKADGTYSWRGDVANPHLGRLDPHLLAALKDAIESADYELIRSRPFRSECPRNYDGSEARFRFRTTNGEQQISSCKTEIDWNEPLFAEVAIIQKHVDKQSSTGTKRPTRPPPN